MTTYDVRACPCCGGNPSLVFTDDVYIICNNCGLSTESYTSARVEEAIMYVIRTWNIRSYDCPTQWYEISI